MRGPSIAPRTSPHACTARPAVLVPLAGWAAAIFSVSADQRPCTAGKPGERHHSARLPGFLRCIPATGTVFALAACSVLLPARAHQHQPARPAAPASSAAVANRTSAAGPGVYRLLPFTRRQFAAAAALARRFTALYGTTPPRLAQLTGRGDNGAATLGVVIAAVAAVILLLVPVLITAATSALNPSTCAQLAAAQQPAPAPAADSIPRNYLALFQQAGRKYGIPWTVLAAIGKVESDDGRDDGPSSAGALGPMQFLPTTWAAYGDGGNIDDPADAIPAAARYLLASGAPADIPAAIFAYNHSAGYVATVLSWASTYASGRFSLVATQRADTSCTLAIGAQALSKIAAQIISYALAQIGKPYQWGAEGPGAFDCSGLVYAAYRSVGIILPRTTFGMWPLQPHIPAGHEQPGDLVFFNTGPGTAPDHPGHVGLVIGGGKMVVASCTTCGPIAIVSYRGNPSLVGFVRPLADPALTSHRPKGHDALDDVLLWSQRILMEDLRVRPCQPGANHIHTGLADLVEPGATPDCEHRYGAGAAPAMEPGRGAGVKRGY